MFFFEWNKGVCMKGIEIGFVLCLKGVYFVQDFIGWR